MFIQFYCLHVSDDNKFWKGTHNSSFQNPPLLYLKLKVLPLYSLKDAE